MPNQRQILTLNSRSRQGRIKTKLGLMLLPGKGPIFFLAFKTDQEVQDSSLTTQPPFTERRDLHNTYNDVIGMTK